MNNKMEINTHRSIIEYKKQNEQTSRTETDIDREFILLVARWEMG